MEITNKKILITGATDGIGKALTKLFLAKDNTVIAVGRTTGKLADIAHHHLHLYSTDLTQKQNVEQLIDWIKKEHSDLDILINNAGIQHNYSFLEDELKFDKVEEELSINLHAPLQLSEALIPLFLKSGGPKAIINVTSGLADVPKASAPVYCASKAAIKQFSKALKWQLEDTNIRVFDLSPPLVDTGMTRGRGKGKITPEQLADEFYSALQKNRYHIDIGKVKWLKRINRLSPKLAERIMKNAV
jgi:uncharacterized oxidoreductase